MDMDTDTQTRWKSQKGVDGEAWKRSGKKMGATVAVGGLGRKRRGEGKTTGPSNGRGKHDARPAVPTKRREEPDQDHTMDPAISHSQLRDKMHKTSRHRQRQIAAAWCTK